MARSPRKSPAPVRRPSSTVEALVERLDRVQDREVVPGGVATGFASIDQVLGGGLRPEDLVVLAGDIGSGKSSLALSIASRAASRGTRVLFLSGEMGEDRLMERVLAMEGRATLDDLRRGTLNEETRGAVGLAALRLRDLPLRFGKLAGNFEEVEKATGPRQPEIDLLVVDNIHQAVGSGASSDDMLADATRRLKSLALDRKLVVLGIAHLPHHRADREDPRPVLDDLGGGGAIKQHADVVLAVFREEMYRPGYGVEGATELIVAKNRGGPTGFVDLYFHRRWLRFEDLLDP
ncbi:MAG: DnaB-like helicase C-terminal domain-containing protein [Gemmatimonadota bacterium]